MKIQIRLLGKEQDFLAIADWGVLPLDPIHMSTSKKTIKYSQVVKKTSDDSAWTIIHDKVYDVTEFLPEHPGGYDVLLDHCGKFLPPFIV